MMRYVCVQCGAGGAGGDQHLNSGPATYHCHECPGRSTMWPELLAKQHMALKENCDRLKASRPDVPIEALCTVLQALIGPDYLIRELQMTRGVSGENPIDQLLDSYNAWVEAANGKSQT